MLKTRGYMLDLSKTYRFMSVSFSCFLLCIYMIFFKKNNRVHKSRIENLHAQSTPSHCDKRVTRNVCVIWCINFHLCNSNPFSFKLFTFIVEVLFLVNPENLFQSAEWDSYLHVVSYSNLWTPWTFKPFLGNNCTIFHWISGFIVQASILKLALV